VTDLTIETPDAMADLGALVASQLVQGDLVALNGQLGAGKTTFARGLGTALGVESPVTSPTFVIARTHARELGAPLVHVDAYRLSSAFELEDLDIDFAGSIVVVEWGVGMLDGISESWLELEIERPLGGREPNEGIEPRRVRVIGHGPRWTDLSWLARLG
jgi:tRNA threonylcarbamoyladenosine biosynthesis protein TsaE